MGRFLRKCALAAAIAAAVSVPGRSRLPADGYIPEPGGHRRDGALRAAAGSHRDGAVFGSSHGRDAFRAWEGTEGFFNFSMSSQTPEYDWMQFREFSPRFREDALVILTVSYMSPYWTESQEAFRTEAGAVLPYPQPQEHRGCGPGPLLAGAALPAADGGYPGCGAGVFPASGARGGQAEESTDRETALLEQSRIIRDHLSLIEPVYPQVSPVMWEAYRSILSRCQEEGWTAVLVTPPYLEVYNQVFSQEFYQQFSRQVQSLLQEYGVVWLDYSHREEYAQSYGWFRNIDHLNAAGSAEFLRVFQADLETVRPAA